jgi:hypothetical protein
VTLSWWLDKHPEEGLLGHKIVPVLKSLESSYRFPLWLCSAHSNSVQALPFPLNLGYWGVMRDDRTQVSIGKAKLTSVEGCATDRVLLASTLGGKSAKGWSLMQAAPHPDWMGFGWGKWPWSRKSKDLPEQVSKQFLRLGHLVITWICSAKKNRLLF